MCLKGLSKAYDVVLLNPFFSMSHERSSTFWDCISVVCVSY